MPAGAVVAASTVSGAAPFRRIGLIASAGKEGAATLRRGVPNRRRRRPGGQSDRSGGAATHPAGCHGGV